MARLLLVFPALLAVAALAGAVGSEPGSARAQTSSSAETVTVSGVGSVKAVPDQADLSFGVETRGASAEAAIAANSTVMTKLIAALRDAGGRDVATQWVSVSPNYGDGGTINGYAASNSVSAEIGVGRAGDLIDAGVAAGANEVSGPDMSSSDTNRLYRQALAAAVSDARLRAETLAKAAGRTLGAIMSVVEGGGQPVPVYGRAVPEAAAATPVVPGQQETTANVTVTFALQ